MSVPIEGDTSSFTYVGLRKVVDYFHDIPKKKEREKEKEEKNFGYHEYLMSHLPTLSMYRRNFVVTVGV